MKDKQDDRRGDQFGPQPSGEADVSPYTRGGRIRRSSDKGETAHESKGAK